MCLVKRRILNAMRARADAEAGAGPGAVRRALPAGGQQVHRGRAGGLPGAQVARHAVQGAPSRACHVWWLRV